ncbi:MAG TPA: HD domain-containing phosphohydrolase [Desulfomonilaceae bacterium]|nr:HD domain-containing phosphohydrolase [Desulfomonilaceae bacterium]
MNTQDKTKEELVDELKSVCQRLNEFEPEEVHSPVTKVREEILVVDDEPRICELLSRWLTAEGYRCASAANGEIALNSLAGKKYDLVVSDIMMPGMSGLDLLKVVKTFSPDTAMIIATAVSDRQTAVMALELGAYGYVMKPFERNEVLISVANALERRRMTLLMREYERSLEHKVVERTAEVRLREEQIIFRLLSASEFRDDETGAHVRRIGLYSSAMAKQLGWGTEAVDDIRLAAPMHDVGKIGIPDRILQKPGKLTRKEFEIMKKHAEIGARILDNPDVPLLRMAKEIALSHHEKWDGSGYPYGLAGESIPEAGRIVAVVDVYDALVYDRVYRHAVPEKKALSKINEGRGTHFDPRILDCFISLLPEIRLIREEIGN